MQRGTELSFPAAFLERMKEDLKEEYPDFLQSLEGEEQKALRLNPLSGFGGFDGRPGSDWKLERVPWEENGYYYDAADSVISPGKHPLHYAGAYYIQEASAMYPVRLLDPKPGEAVLDLCAAPGGKSTQIAALMANEGLLISNEIIPSRAAVLSSNIERMGIRNTVVTNLDPAGISSLFPAFFDRILVDAPCSGEGMLRRGDAARENWSEENVRMCAQRQRDILDEAAKCLKCGGTLVYSTCTFSGMEDEDNIDLFLKDHEDYELLKMEKLYPHRIRGEGHFAALLRRKGIRTEPDLKNKGKKSRPGCPKRDLKILLEGLGDILGEDMLLKIPPERIISFKGAFYLLPEGIWGVDGIKTLRPGLCLGVLKKDRFEPAHSLASALRYGEAKRCFDLKASDRRAFDFLSGLSLSLDENEASGLKDGWCLISFEGAGAGFGKKTGSIIKNHYPKGLRINI